MGSKSNPGCSCCGADRLYTFVGRYGWPEDIEGSRIVTFGDGLYAEDGERESPSHAGIWSPIFLDDKTTAWFAGRDVMYDEETQTRIDGDLFFARGEQQKNRVKIKRKYRPRLEHLQACGVNGLGHVMLVSHDAGGGGPATERVAEVFNRRGTKLWEYVLVPDVTGDTGRVNHIDADRHGNWYLASHMSYHNVGNTPAPPDDPRPRDNGGRGLCSISPDGVLRWARGMPRRESTPEDPYYYPGGVFDAENNYLAGYYVLDVAVPPDGSIVWVGDGYTLYGFSGATGDPAFGDGIADHQFPPGSGTFTGKLKCDEYGYCYAGRHVTDGSEVPVGKRFPVRVYSPEDGAIAASLNPDRFSYDKRFDIKADGSKLYLIGGFTSQLVCYDPWTGDVAGEVLHEPDPVKGYFGKAPPIWARPSVGPFGRLPDEIPEEETEA